MVTALAVLTAIGAGQLTAAPIVESLPKLAQNPAWMVFGGSFISGLYLLVTLVHRQRARDLANLMFGEVRSPLMQRRSLPKPVTPTDVLARRSGPRVHMVQARAPRGVLRAGHGGLDAHHAQQRLPELKAKDDDQDGHGVGV